jgi:hypothetical protein
MNMRKIIFLTMALILALGLAGLTACGGDNGDTGNGTGTIPTEAASEPPANGNGLTWDDMPIYSGADQIQKGSWAIPAEDDQYSEAEWRYYETGDDTSDVSAFYKSKMTANGWEEMMWMEAEGMAWGYYSKNNEDDGAMFWCSVEDGHTVFALMRASR